MAHKNVPPRRAIQLALGAFGVALWGAWLTNAPAAAQPDASPPAANEQIIIHAPEYVVRRSPVSGRQLSLRNAEVITMEKQVSYADLDLSKPADVAELQKRITDTAKDVCAELNRRFPKTSFQVTVDKDCVKSAVDEGMTVHKQLVAAAK